MFLSTKLLPRSDTELADKEEESDRSIESRNRVEVVERFNESVDDISNFFNESVADDAILGKLVSFPGKNR
ncbi:unnamed protein product [Hapterophycus canaliculatus]